MIKDPRIVLKVYGTSKPKRLSPKIKSINPPATIAIPKIRIPIIARILPPKPYLFIKSLILSILLLPEF